MGTGNIKGGLHIGLEQSDLFPGEEMQGTVYVQLEEPMPSCTLYLSLKGKESVYWEEQHTRTITEDGKSRTESYTEYYRQKKTITKVKQVIYN